MYLADKPPRLLVYSRKRIGKVKTLSFVRVALRTPDRVSYREVNNHSNILKCPLFSAQLLTSTAKVRNSLQTTKLADFSLTCFIVDKYG
nr:MAG TPA: hypothetical protein [Caudoviricetes sp.]